MKITSTFSFSYVTEHLSPGDYVIIGDTWNKSVHAEFDVFMEMFGNKFLVDTSACDLYGFNVSWQFNSILMYGGEKASGGFEEVEE